ncbi:hypothetical protein PACTADRAFT_72560 [Pachysolen tannophilus NRRL Y-2460]|uniref:5-hydroxyisourate hydrolase n=1 Tax=Pachysolen tannophilus NRRL Y-2460 TaxID=669874 RepID=A0A1E4TNJ7_PACTA|nr:hypothetical protein PACTADRAFT_72560 [Pachysolen tannophilus NRRL Y-2460]
MANDPITCHILDTANGRPAANVTCAIFCLSGAGAGAGANGNDTETSIKPFALAKSNKDGRVGQWTIDPKLTNATGEKIGISNGTWTVLIPGIYKIRFQTAKYFKTLPSADTQNSQNRTFFPFIDVIFEVNEPPDHHYHVPLLLSNHSYTTYRGS